MTDYTVDPAGGGVWCGPCTPLSIEQPPCRISYCVDEALEEGASLSLPCGSLWPAADREGWQHDHLPACAICSGNFGAAQPLDDPAQERAARDAEWTRSVTDTADHYRRTTQTGTNDRGATHINIDD
jgi:hypothetical protein